LETNDAENIASAVMIFTPVSSAEAICYHVVGTSRRGQRSGQKFAQIEVTQLKYTGRVGLSRICVIVMSMNDALVGERHGGNFSFFLLSE